MTTRRSDVLRSHGPRLAAAVLGLALATPAVAQRANPAVELRLDYFQPSFDSSVRLDSQELGIGTDLDLEGDLGMESDTGAFRANAVFRPGRRARITLDYHAFERSGSAVVGRAIQFGNTVFNANALVDSSLDSQFVAAGFGYALLATEQAELGLSLSVAWVELEATLRSALQIPGAPVIEIVERGSTEGPVPMLGVFGAWWLGDRFRLLGDARYLEVSDFDGWDGSALDLGVRFEWFVIDNLALGVGYSLTDIEASSREARDLGRADYSYDGFRAGVTVAF
jgi:opacity protein-like surface antigen